MPLYDYRCDSCGEMTEVLQHYDAAPLAACPKC
ncbi:MAG: zinc ribbon domain-containing protein, partial [Acidobacteria bacterium]|nr:zinc ribbon domain-containing protein [Acidobacteriota bacterium]